MVRHHDKRIDDIAQTIKAHDDVLDCPSKLLLPQNASARPFVKPSLVTTLKQSMAFIPRLVIPRPSVLSFEQLSFTANGVQFLLRDGISRAPRHKTATTGLLPVRKAIGRLGDRRLAGEEPRRRQSVLRRQECRRPCFCSPSSRGISACRRQPRRGRYARCDIPVAAGKRIPPLQHAHAEPLRTQQRFRRTPAPPRTKDKRLSHPCASASYALYAMELSFDLM